MEPRPLSFAISEPAARRLAAERPDVDSIPEITPKSGLSVAVLWRRVGDLQPGDALFQNDLGDLLIMAARELRESMDGGVLHWDGSGYVLISRVQRRPQVHRPATSTAITAAKVKTLREQTGLGMMTCKRALEAARGDLAAARRLLRGGDR